MVEDVQIPDAVRASVARRLRLLGRVERRTILRAAAIGHRFDVTILVATARSRADRVRAALDRACALQLIVAEDDSGERYAFRHALTRDIVYAELIEDRIRDLHRRIGDTLERSSPQAGAGLSELAEHFWLANDSARALRFNELAGDRAADVHALADARRYYERARSLRPAGSVPFVRLSRKIASLDGRDRLPGEPP